MSELDRRDYYRISDCIHLIQTPLTSRDVSGDPYDERYGIPRQALLVSRLQTISNDNRDLLRQVADNNRALGSYLRSVDEKIELLAQYLSGEDPALKQREPVTLSEGGLTFYSDTVTPVGSLLHLVMVLFPNMHAIATIGRVRSTEAAEPDDSDQQRPGRYRIGVEFSVLLEPDRKQLVRHIRRLESQELREQGQNLTDNL